MTLGQRLGLTGAQRIILDEIEARQQHGKPISVSILANATHYHRRTVVYTLQELKGLGVLEILQPCNGAQESVYRIQEVRC